MSVMKNFKKCPQCDDSWILLKKDSCGPCTKNQHIVDLELKYAQQEKMLERAEVIMKMKDNVAKKKAEEGFLHDREQGPKD